MIRYRLWVTLTIRVFLILLIEIPYFFKKGGHVKIIGKPATISRWREERD